MYIKNRFLSVVYKFCISLCGIVGIQMQLSLFSGTAANWGMFRFFTNLSNLACVLYFLADAFYLLIQKKEEGITFCPVLKMIVMMSVTVTMLIAQFLLGNFHMNGAGSIALILLHRVVPPMAILDWLLFDKKGWMTKLSPVWGVTAPLVYFAYAVIAAQTESSVQKGSRYPYPFMDIDKLGVPTVAVTVAALAAGFIVLGYLFYAVDHTLAKKAEHKRAARKSGSSQKSES